MGNGNLCKYKGLSSKMERCYWLADLNEEFRNTEKRARVVPFQVRQLDRAIALARLFPPCSGPSADITMSRR